MEYKIEWKILNLRWHNLVRPYKALLGSVAVAVAVAVAFAVAVAVAVAVADTFRMGGDHESYNLVRPYKAL